ncbi:MAG: hypothetical protein LBB90_09290 [Tannerella sp.]|jgi:hypothetical protein|nr:hypothetical protein [Tannerella sp.]
MTDKQIAKLNMLQTVIRVLDENEPLYRGIPVFVKTVNDLKGMAKGIEWVGDLKSKITLQGITNEMNVSETAFVNRIVTMANVLLVLAADINNVTMLPKVRVTKSQLYRSPDNERLSIARHVHAEALAHADVITQYGISVDAIYELETAISRYENQIAASQTVIAEPRMDAVNPVYLFADMDTLLNDRLDRLISPFKISAPGFYEAYFNARNIINTAARKQKQADQQEDNI